jgi:23S rRNA (adenine2503-C2)-methyltransferase
VNDSEADARRLPDLLAGIPSKVNLIPFNAHPLSPYRRPADTKVAAFRRTLQQGGLAVYVRRSRGRDIDAACGQLAAKAKPAELVEIRR